MTKNCLTCKYEPDWDDFNDGECKKLPEFIKLIFSKYQGFSGKRVNVSGFRNNRVTLVTDCNLWEGKE